MQAQTINLISKRLKCKIEGAPQKKVRKITVIKSK